MTDFICKGCGSCCRVSGYVRLKDQEAERIAEFLKIPLRQFTESYTRLTEDRTGLSLIENEDASCVFLNQDSTCRINPVKPRQCAAFPFEWSFKGWEGLCQGKKVI